MIARGLGPHDAGEQRATTVVTVRQVMQGRYSMRMVLFVVFFSIGAAALGGSVLYADLLRHYQNKRILKEAAESLRKLESLNADYDGLVNQLEQDPNLVMQRIAPVVVGAERREPNTAYPKVAAEQLAAAREALTKDTEDDFNEPAVPEWLSRCGEPRKRSTLFAGGACLIVVSLLFFGPPKARQGE